MIIHLILIIYLSKSLKILLKKLSEALYFVNCNVFKKDQISIIKTLNSESYCSKSYYKKNF